MNAALLAAEQELVRRFPDCIGRIQLREGDTVELCFGRRGSKGDPPRLYFQWADGSRRDVHDASLQMRTDAARCFPVLEKALLVYPKTRAVLQYNAAAAARDLLAWMAKGKDEKRPPVQDALVGMLEFCRDCMCSPCACGGSR